MKKHLLSPLIATMLLLNCLATLHSQQPKEINFDSAMNVIKDKIAGQEWAPAETAIRQLDQAAPKSKGPEILFIRGYLFQTRASVETDSVKEQELMARALATYRRASDLAPRNASIHRNIAILLAQQNKTNSAIARMRLAYTQQPEIAANSRFLGDLYMQAQRYDSSRWFYEQTIKNDPSIEPVYERLQYVYRRVKVSPDDVLSLCSSMCRNGHADLAASMLVDLVKGNYENEAQQTQVVRAFVWWVYLLGQRQVSGNGGPGVFDISWNHPAYRELIEAWIHPLNYPYITWWRNEEPMKLSDNLTVIPVDVFVGALQILGGQLIEKDDISAGVEVYRHAYEIVAERNERIVFTNGDSPDIFFEAANNLGVAYARYPAIDPDGERFSSLANRLLFGKGEAYRSNNKRAITKFHTTLGVIYATKKQWDEPSPANGIYQLEKAIALAPETQNTAPLKMLLVGGYLKKQNLEAARSLLLLAAGDFLNDDNLSTASAALSRYDSIHGDKHVAGFHDISRIIEFRSKIPHLTNASFQDVDSLNDAIDTLTGGTALPDNFYKIQRFKMLSDCGTRAIKVNDQDAAAVLHIKALTQASDVDNMGNLNDFNRLNQQQKTVRENIQFEGRPKSETMKKSQSNLQGVKTWQVPMPGNNHSGQLQMKTDVLVAAQVADVIHEQTTLSEQKPQVVINQTNNTVEIRHSATPNEEFKRELEKPVQKTGMEVHYIRNVH